MSFNTKMTAIADEIRTLSNTTDSLGLDEMASYIGEANSEIDSQADLISQIQAAVDNLPEAGGGSMSYDTCTLQIYNDSGVNYELAYTSIVDGKIVGKYYNKPNSFSFECLCGSALCIYTTAGNVYSSALMHISTIDDICTVYAINISANESATIEISGGSGD